MPAIREHLVNLETSPPSANCIVITNSEETVLREDGIEVKVLPA